MPYHDSLPFLSLHKAKIESGLLVSRPATPEGLGDAYFATDANGGLGAIYLTNLAGTAWVEFTQTVPNLSDLLDVNITTPADGSALIYNSGTSKWIDGTVSSSIATLTDVDITGLADGYILIWDNVGGKWVVGQRVVAVGDLSDVATFTQVKGDIMASNGTVFNKIGVGTNNQVLMADSAETNGVKWATSSVDFNVILTASGDVLVDSSGNVLTEI